MIDFHQVNDSMNENDFWQIIESTLKFAIDNTDDLENQQEIQYQQLNSKLNNFNWQEIVKFQNRFDELYEKAYTSELWCAAFIMNGGCSDDSFMDFRAWVISQGRDIYYKAIENPDSLSELSFVNTDVEYYDFEDLLYLSAKVFEEKYGDEIYNFLGLDEPNKDNSVTAFEFNWNEDDESSMKAICPKLYDKFWGE